MALAQGAAFHHDMVEEFDFVDFDEDSDELPLDEFPDEIREDNYGSDFDDDADEQPESHLLSDTTAAQARRGKDIQGIPWNQLQLTRGKYRENRLQHYKNYENLNVPHEQLEKECLQVSSEGRFYSFRHNTVKVKSTVVHFQLRNLVWATSKHDAYVMHNSSVHHWSALRQSGREVLNPARPVIAANGAERESWAEEGALRHMQISTMCVRNNLLVAGGFRGEMMCKFLDRHGVSFCTKITYDENAITNAVEIYNNASGATRLMTSNNDSIVRVFDIEKFEVLQNFKFPWPVNHTSVSPDNSSIVVVGDCADGFLADSQTGKVIAVLNGHLDFSFASAWHPNGRVFATGNQDTSCRLWDVRNLNSCLATLKGRIGAIRSLRFTSDGRFLAMAEPADFIHIFDVNQGYKVSQEIDIFGEIAGISFSPDAEALFIGIADRTYGSLLEYNRCHVNTYLDSYY